MKQLLIKLLNHLESFDPQDGEHIRTQHQDTSGLCALILDIHVLKIINQLEHCLLDEFLNSEIKKSKYTDYPVTYAFCDYGAQCSLFFFEPRDWTIRKKWLQDIINTL